MKEEPQTAQKSPNTPEFEKFKYKVEIVKWFIGSVTLVVISMMIEWGFKDRAAGLNEIKEYDKYATELIILNNDPIKKRMLAQYFSKVTPSEKLREGWEAYYTEVDKEYREFLRQDSLAKIRLAELSKDTSETKNTLNEIEVALLSKQIHENQRIFNQPLILPENRTIQPIVYIQFGNGSDRPKINALRSKISIQGLQAPGVELVESAKDLASNEIRYYWDSDAIFANSLKNILEQEGIETVIKHIPTLKNKTKEGTLELWLK
ncbi:hypothetical protein [Algoriphagus jejuensis]|uniref:hypothetical protein n=1 Tax=Algoriphagus jejuensis TaxID=419934 RepID=UPI0031E079AC